MEYEVLQGYWWDESGRELTSTRSTVAQESWDDDFLFQNDESALHLSHEPPLRLSPRKVRVGGSQGRGSTLSSEGDIFGRMDEDGEFDMPVGDAPRVSVTLDRGEEERTVPSRRWSMKRLGIGRRVGEREVITASTTPGDGSGSAFVVLGRRSRTSSLATTGAAGTTGTTGTTKGSKRISLSTPARFATDLSNRDTLRSPSASSTSPYSSLNLSATSLSFADSTLTLDQPSLTLPGSEIDEGEYRRVSSPTNEMPLGMKRPTLVASPNSSIRAFFPPPPPVPYTPALSTDPTTPETSPDAPTTARPRKVSKKPRLSLQSFSLSLSRSSSLSSAPKSPSSPSRSPFSKSHKQSFSLSSLSFLPSPSPPPPAIPPIIYRRNSLSDLKIPHRISSSQVRLEEDLSRIQEFARAVLRTLSSPLPSLSQY